MNPAITLGSPLFQDPLHASTAKQSIGQAWHDAYAAGGSAAAAARQTHGDFAAAWGGGIASNSSLVVDRFSMQSLYWAFDANGLRFAPTATALAGPDPKIDPQAIFDYLFFHVVPAPRTIFNGVQKLPPGCELRLENGQPVVKPYWRPDFQPDNQADFKVLRDEFRLRLRSAVAGQLNGSKPACFLSGGTDSSTVAGMIREATGAPAAAYSIGFEAEGYDEMAYARLAAKHFGAEHHEYYVTPDDLVRSVPVVAAHYDQPFGNSSALPSYFCAQMAKADGVDRILAGDGGDELFGGNLRYAKQRWFEYYSKIPAAVRGGVLEPWLGTPAERKNPLLRKAASYIEQARAPLPARLDFYNLLLRLNPVEVLTPGFLAQIDRGGPSRDQQAIWDASGAKQPLDQHLAFDWYYTLAQTDLPKVSGTTALAGLQVGFPMLDQPLVDFSMRLPTNYKLRGGQLRWFFKEALRGFLPDEIINKPKQGFGLPFGVWATRHAPLKALAADALHGIADRGIVQRTFVQALLDRHLAAHPGYFGEMIWILMMLEQWLRFHAPRYSVQA